MEPTKEEVPVVVEKVKKDEVPPLMKLDPETGQIEDEELRLVNIEKMFQNKIHRDESVLTPGILITDKEAVRKHLKTNLQSALVSRDSFALKSKLPEPVVVDILCFVLAEDIKLAKAVSAINESFAKLISLLNIFTCEVDGASYKLCDHKQRHLHCSHPLVLFSNKPCTDCKRKVPKHYACEHFKLCCTLGKHKRHDAEHICKTCYQIGHHEDQCPFRCTLKLVCAKAFHTRVYHQCDVCHQEGHVAEKCNCRHCRSKEHTKKDCAVCKSVGHITDTCQTNKCHVCGKNHQEYDCPEVCVCQTPVQENYARSGWQKLDAIFESKCKFERQKKKEKALIPEGKEEVFATEEVELKVKNLDKSLEDLNWRNTFHKDSEHRCVCCGKPWDDEHRSHPEGVDCPYRCHCICNGQGWPDDPNHFCPACDQMNMRNRNNLYPYVLNLHPKEHHECPFCHLKGFEHEIKDCPELCHCYKKIKSVLIVKHRLDQHDCRHNCGAVGFKHDEKDCPKRCKCCPCDSWCIQCHTDKTSPFCLGDKEGCPCKNDAPTEFHKSLYINHTAEKHKCCICYEEVYKHSWKECPELCVDEHPSPQNISVHSKSLHMCERCNQVGHKKEACPVVSTHVAKEKEFTLDEVFSTPK